MRVQLLVAAADYWVFYIGTRLYSLLAQSRQYASLELLCFRGRSQQF